MIFKDKKILKTLWIGMFILCALLGFVPEQEGANKWLLFAFSLLFFVPAALLLWQCKQTGDVKNLRLIRNLSIASLAATVVLLAANFLSMLAPEAVGTALYYILIVVSTPMICSHFWFVSLFLWATVLWSSILLLKETKK